MGIFLLYNLSYVILKYKNCFMFSVMYFIFVYMFKKKNQNGGWSVLIVNDDML